MNVNKRLAAIAAIGLAGVLAGGAAQARDIDLRISLPLPPLPRVVITTPSHGGYQHGHLHGHQHGGWERARGGRDADRDGIPNRYDRVHNPGYDRDGDGVPNRYDRYPNRAQQGHHHGHQGHFYGWRQQDRHGRGGRD